MKKIEIFYSALKGAWLALTPISILTAWFHVQTRPFEIGYDTIFVLFGVLWVYRRYIEDRRITNTQIVK